MIKTPILILGGRGKTGRHVTDRLRASGREFAVHRGQLELVQAVKDSGADWARGTARAGVLAA